MYFSLLLSLTLPPSFIGANCRRKEVIVWRQEGWICLPQTGEERPFERDLSVVVDRMVGGCPTFPRECTMCQHVLPFLQSQVYSQCVCLYSVCLSVLVCTTVCVHRCSSIVTWRCIRPHYSFLSECILTAVSCKSSFSCLEGALSDFVVSTLWYRLFSKEYLYLGTCQHSWWDLARACHCVSADMKVLIQQCFVHLSSGTASSITSSAHHW